ncbi:hypothetical protein [Bradymonas sediminis]|uniref:Uncharacterized protein n=1 Tax=Bradymonas sediminis TaxID=1548548 RepID=A0A2Z4FIN1_9DELT|nr:hypothetical protein [Bradymonas sediminis]AWV88538.1 hypothetical protein DN745_03975 [Bradymonas sediminis]TDP77678.1 hypothetical protein DFR33_101588 [Bradymonas sediminis]
MSNMNGINPNRMNSGAIHHAQAKQSEGSGGGSGFGKLMGTIADGALAGLAAVAPVLPGGELIKIAANGLRGVSSDAPAGLGGGRGEQLDEMWAMQEDNQVFNLQYMHLQQSMQSENRHFSTMSNLLKARHDTAKAAINNMRV